MGDLIKREIVRLGSERDDNREYDRYQTGLLFDYADEISVANGNEQEIDDIIKKVIAWFARSVSYHVDFSSGYSEEKATEWRMFIDAMHAVLHAIPQNLAKQRNFVHKILIHKNDVISRERLQSDRADNEIENKQKSGKLPKDGEKQGIVKREIYNRYMKPVRDYENNYTEFLGSIDLSAALDYNKLFKGMDAVEKEFSLAAINAVLEGRR